jgi:hypothetical protein
VFGAGDMRRGGARGGRSPDRRRHSQRGFFHRRLQPASRGNHGWEAMFRDAGGLPINVNRILVIGGAGGVGSLAIPPPRALHRGPGARTWG